MALMGLDVGGTGIKATVFNNEGTILCTSYREYDLQHPAPGCFEYDPRMILSSAYEVLSEAAAQCPEDILGIGVSSFGESIVLLDEDRNILANSLMYLDTRGQEQWQEMLEKNDDLTFRLHKGTGIQLKHTTIKLHVLKQDHPDIFDKAKTACFMADFVLYMLGAEHYTDSSVAVTTGGFNLDTMSWDRELWAWSGMDPDILPGVVEPGTCIGTLSPAAAEKIGIQPGAKLVIGGLDHIPSSVGCGVLEKGMMMDAIGTVDCFTLITDNFDPRNFGGDMLFLPHYTKGCYGALTANMAGGVLLKWFREHLGKYEKEMWLKDGLDFYGEFEKTMPQEPTDLIVLPRFAGYTEKFSDRAGILNLTLSTTNQELYRGFMEGATFEMYSLLKSYKQPVDSVTAVGGGAQSKTYMQIRADVFNVPVYTVNSTQPGALGNAMASGVAAGIFRDVAEAVTACVRRKDVFTPNPKNHDYYMEQYEKYLKIYKMLEEFKA